MGRTAREESVVIQRATRAHTDGLLALFEKHRTTADGPWAVSADLLAKRLERLNERYDALSLVALQGKTPVGFLGATACTPITQPSPCAHVLDLVIDSDADVTAVEDRLLSRAIEEAKEMGCGGLTLAEPSNEEELRRLGELGFARSRSYLELQF